MAVVKLACLALIALITTVSFPVSESAVTCNKVAISVAPCLLYLTGGGKLLPSCCGGIRALARSAKTTRDRRVACRCLQSAATGVRGINLRRVSSLAYRCRVRIPYRISPSVDCRRVG